ncbi:hypothetical protein ADMFC3_19100 [Geovibrio sp. ADMFC3]
MKFLKSLCYAVLLSIFIGCGGSNGGSDSNNTSSPLSYFHCSGSFTGDDTGTFEVSYDKGQFEQITHSNNFGSYTKTGTMTYQNGIYIFTSTLHDITVTFKEEDYSVTGTWNNKYDGKDGVLTGSCDEVEFN